MDIREDDLPDVDIGDQVVARGGHEHYTIMLLGIVESVILTGDGRQNRIEIRPEVAVKATDVGEFSLVDIDEVISVNERGLIDDKDAYHRFSDFLGLQCRYEGSKSSLEQYVLEYVRENA